MKLMSCLERLPTFFGDRALGALLPGRDTVPLNFRVNSDSAFQVRDLSVAYQDKIVLEKIDFEVPQKTLSAIVGPNGAGKSTLIKAALGLIPKLTGTVAFYGRPLVAGNCRDVAYVPQRNSVDWDFPASARDVVAMGLYGQIGWLRPVTRKHLEEADHWLSEVGIADFAARQIGQLSGGQQQRVFLARALAQKAQLYLMDEPFAGVDAATEQAILEGLHLLKAQGKTVVCVHHDLQSVSAYFDHLLILNKTAIAQGDAKNTLNESNLRAAYGEGFQPLATLSSLQQDTKP